MGLSDRNMAHWTDIYVPLSYPGSGDTPTSSVGTPGSGDTPTSSVGTPGSGDTTTSSVGTPGSGDTTTSSVGTPGSGIWIHRGHGFHWEVL